MDMAPNNTLDDAKLRYAHRAKLRPLFLAIIVQAVLLLGAVFVVVLVPQLRKEPEFVAKKTIYLPQRELEHQMALAEFQQAASSPIQMERLQTSSMIDSSMPSLPDLPATQFSPVDPMVDPMSDMGALFGSSGLMGSLQGMVGEASSVSFFGIEDQATRIVIAFDISSSVANKAKKSGISVKRIQEEAARLIQGLNSNTLFGLVQFSRTYDPYQSYLVTGTQANKESALQWLKDEFRTNGKAGSGWIRKPVDGIESVMEAVFAYQPDVVFLISDASFQRTKSGGGSETVPWAELRRSLNHLQEEAESRVRIHFIGFQVKEADKSEMETLVKRTGGRYQEL